MDLHNEVHTALDIASGGLVMTYTSTDPSPRTVYARINVGTVDKPIAGGSNYVTTVAINGVRISPDSNVQVTGGVTRTILHSREFVLRQNDTLTITVDGAPADVDVYTEATLMDFTPLTAGDVYGEGSIVVDQNYGGENNLQIKDTNGASVQDAQIVAYLQTDYDAGHRGSTYVRGRTTSDVNGYWRQQLFLDPEQYILLVSKTGVYEPLVAELTVTAEP